MLSFDCSRALSQQVCEVLAGGVSSGIRQTARPLLYFARADGPYFYDVDGNEFVDYTLAWGPLTPYIDKIAWVRYALDRIMSPDVPAEKYFRQHVPTFHPVDSALNREMKLTAHAEMQLARLRCYGAKARTLYADGFFAVFKRTTELW